MARGLSIRDVSRLVACVLTISLGPFTASAGASRGEPAPAATVASAYVWDAANNPVPGLTIALRNLRNARVERTVISDGNGHVSFRGIDSSTYVLEIVNARGLVIAVGQVFSIAPGESVATFIRLPAKSPWFAGLFSHAGAVAVATAAGLGATALSTTGQPQSPGR